MPSEGTTGLQLCRAATHQGFTVDATLVGGLFKQRLELGFGLSVLSRDRHRLRTPRAQSKLAGSTMSFSTQQAAYWPVQHRIWSAKEGRQGASEARASGGICAPQALYTSLRQLVMAREGRQNAHCSNHHQPSQHVGCRGPPACAVARGVIPSADDAGERGADEYAGT